MWPNTDAKRSVLYSHHFKWLLISLYTLFGGDCVAQKIGPSANLSPRYNSGFNTIRLDDLGNEVTRSLGGSSSFTEFDLWYPAQISRRSKPSKFNYFFRQHELRLKRSNSDNNWDGFARELSAYLTFESDKSTSNFNAIETSSYRKAKVANGQFPVLLYFTSNHHLTFEHINLYEYLSSHGFVVVVIQPSNYLIDSDLNIDLIPEINDATLVLDYLQKQPYVSPNQIASMGWREGGVKALIAGMFLEEIKAIVSIDGDEVIYSSAHGMAPKHLDFKGSKYFRPENVSAPYLHIDSDVELQHLLDFDSVYSPIPYLGGPNYYLRFREVYASEVSPIAEMLDSNRGRILDNSMNFRYSLIQKFLRSSFNRDLLPFTSELEGLILNNNKSIDLFLPQIHYDSYEIRGKVVDANSELPIPFAQVRIKGQQLGILGTRDGGFKINYLETHQNNDIEVLVPGYKAKRLSLQKLYELPSDSVVIKMQKLRANKNKDTSGITLNVSKLVNGEGSKFFSSKPFLSKGAEVGVKFSFDKKPGLINSLSFSLASKPSEKLILRPRIYSIKNNTPAENLLSENILFEVDKASGMFTIDLSPYYLEVNGDVMVSLELVESGDSPIAFMAVLDGEQAKFKNVWNSDWKLLKELPPLFEIEVKYLEDEERQP